MCQENERHKNGYQLTTRIIIYHKIAGMKVAEQSILDSGRLHKGMGVGGGGGVGGSQMKQTEMLIRKFELNPQGSVLSSSHLVIVVYCVT